jgi:hypothetical protein
MALGTLLDNSWVESVALVAAARRADNLSAEARLRMTPWVVAAQARFRVARELRDPESQIVALALLKEAAFFLLCALESADPAPELAARSPKEAWQRFEALAEQPPGAPEQLALVRAVFSSDEPLSVDRVAASEVNELRLAAETSVAWLLGLAEIRTPTELARARLIRSALAVLGLVVVVWGLVSYWLSLGTLAPR